MAFYFFGIIISLRPFVLSALDTCTCANNYNSRCTCAVIISSVFTSSVYVHHVHDES